MCYLIGTDEAGYGPNLGPLVVAATAWHLPGQTADQVDLYHLLHKVVVRTTAAMHARQVPIADSKMLYKAGGNLKMLETGLLPALSASGVTLDCWSSAWRHIAPDSQPQLRNDPCYRTYETPLPIDLSPNDLPPRAEALAQALHRAGITLTGIRAVAVFPEQFNQFVERMDNKSAVLSHLTIQLIHRLVATLKEEPILVCCDKHGGRNHYLALLQTAFPESLVEVRRESRALSVYRWGPPHRRVEIRFAVGGESFLPTALASMTAKYLRELAMKAFNAYWGQHVAGLRPTAGYPLDARRFLDDIDHCRRQYRIARDSLWRKR